MDAAPTNPAQAAVEVGTGEEVIPGRTEHDLYEKWTARAPVCAGRYLYLFANPRWRDGWRIGEGGEHMHPDQEPERGYSMHVAGEIAELVDHAIRHGNWPKDAKPKIVEAVRNLVALAELLGPPEYQPETP